MFKRTISKNRIFRKDVFHKKTFFTKTIFQKTSFFEKKRFYKNTYNSLSTTNQVMIFIDKQLYFFTSLLRLLTTFGTLSVVQKKSRIRWNNYRLSHKTIEHILSRNPMTIRASKSSINDCYKIVIKILGFGSCYCSSSTILPAHGNSLCHNHYLMLL